jgi:hypothetical protein
LLPPNPKFQSDLDKQKQRSWIDADWHFWVSREEELLRVLIAVNRLLYKLGNFGIGLAGNPDLPSRSACCASVCEFQSAHDATSSGLGNGRTESPTIQAPITQTNCWI